MTKCTRAKSDMTPCFVRDGELAVATATTGWGAGQRKICVGCEYGIGLLREERAAFVSGEKTDG